MGQALPPVSAVTNGSNPLSLLPKQAEGLGPCCPKTVCPSNSPSGSFQKLHIPILHEKSEKMIYNIAQYSKFHLKSSLAWCVQKTYNFRPYSNHIGEFAFSCLISSLMSIHLSENLLPKTTLFTYYQIYYESKLFRSMITRKCPRKPSPRP